MKKTAKYLKQKDKQAYTNVKLTNQAVGIL